MTTDSIEITEADKQAAFQRRLAFMGKTGHYESVEALAEEIEALKRVLAGVSGWIDVKQELPPNRKTVLAFTVGLSEPNGIRMSSYDKDQPLSMYWHGFIIGKGRGVSHWMPLPEPPTASQKEG